ncbi:hypothetical protein PGQ11_014604 [Apiospora arundinis]|uniref:Uncharacterized protein n=1 Tax=Apiospora arundinis TaxID=335852 RepID=A0ABR2HSQ3_9PEZI
MSENNNAVDNDSSDARTLLHLSIMTHNGMPDLAVKNWAAVAADTGLSVATAKQQFGKDKKLFRTAKQNGPPAAPVIKRRNRGNKQNAAADGDDDVEDDGINALAAPASPATKTRKRASNRNVAAAADDNGDDNDQAIEDNLAIQAASVGPAGPAGPSRRVTRSSTRAKKQDVVVGDHDDQAGEGAVAGPSARPIRAARAAPRPARASRGHGATVAGLAAPIDMTRERENSQNVPDVNENDAHAEGNTSNVPAGPAGRDPSQHFQRWFALGTTKESLAESRQSRRS